MKIRWLGLAALVWLGACDTMDAAPGAGRRPTAQPPLIERNTAPPTPEHLEVASLLTLEEDSFDYLEGPSSRANASESYEWSFEAFNGTHHALLLRAPHRASYRNMLRMIIWGPKGQVERSAKLDLRHALREEVVGVDVDDKGARLLLRAPDPKVPDQFLWSEATVTHCPTGLCLGEKVSLAQPWVPATNPPTTRQPNAPLSFAASGATCAMTAPDKASCLMAETAKRVTLTAQGKELPKPQTCRSPGTLKDGRALVVCQTLTVTPPSGNCQHCHCGTCYFRCRSTTVSYSAPTVWALEAARP